jgi:hypothetical protein
MTTPRSVAAACLACLAIGTSCAVFGVGGNPCRVVPPPSVHELTQTTPPIADDWAQYCEQTCPNPENGAVTGCSLSSVKRPEQGRVGFQFAFECRRRAPHEREVRWRFEPALDEGTWLAACRRECPADIDACVIAQESGGPAKLTCSYSGCPEF